MMHTAPTMIGFACLLLLQTRASASAPDEAWQARFSFQPPPSEHTRLAPHQGLELPDLEVEPAAAGWQMVRVSLPWLAGSLPEGVGLEAVGTVDPGLGEAARPVPVDLRVLTWHPGWPRSVRRGLVSFPWFFPDRQPVRFRFQPTPPQPAAEPGPPPGASGDGPPPEHDWHLGAVRLRTTAAGVELEWTPGEVWRATVVMPPDADGTGGGIVTGEFPARLEIIEHGRHVLWLRLLTFDAHWPRILDVRADSLGHVVLSVHVQRADDGDGHAPPFGWRLTAPHPLAAVAPRSFTADETLDLSLGDRRALFPRGRLQSTGQVEVAGRELVYLACRTEDRLPMQARAWRQATLVLGGATLPPWNATLEADHRYRVEPRFFAALYDSGEEIDLAAWPELDRLRAAHRDFVVAAAAHGLDAGNVTHARLSGPATVCGMNRLNHCRPIFDDFYRSGQTALRQTAVLWCDNTHDLSIWWGDDEFTGGLRYPDARAAGEAAPPDDDRFMWRANSGRHSFCTKGYVAFLYAWEETGDPRMATALRHQVAYAMRHVRADDGETRNVGDVDDFVRLYRMTGQSRMLDEALRLWRELSGRLGPDGLFSQSGAAIEGDRPLIDRDEDATGHPFAKPYILGYALAGCPALLEWLPDDPRLRTMLEGVSGFMAASIDPAGGWRYPAPESSRLLLGQALEHAAQLVTCRRALLRAGRPTDALLDAVERVLQARLAGFSRTGGVLAGLDGWERSSGAAAAADSLADRYPRPSDRDAEPDYDLGRITIDAGPPEALVYLPEVLADYLAARPAERLFATSSRLDRLLERLPPAAEPSPPAAVPPPPPTHAVERLLPTFQPRRLADMRFPGRWSPAWTATAPGSPRTAGPGRIEVGTPQAARAGVRELTATTARLSPRFRAWRREARQTLIDSLGEPPPRAAFAPQILATEDRGSYVAHRVSLALNGWERVLGYLLVPKGAGPFPGAVALHDHGAHFSIGKEKVVRPFDVGPDRTADAQAWVTGAYDGVWIGDALAARGWVVFATDALFWGDRGSPGGSTYEDQQALAANLLHLGMSWAGVMLWDDLRSAEFLQSRPEVDPERIAAIGLSVGGYRTWNLAAATDIVRAGAAICWLGDTQGLTAPGNNQTRGQSSYSMLQPLIRNRLDYPDVAGIACPKPMLFFNGTEDPLFPVATVERSVAGLRRIWDDQDAGDRLETRLWPVPHRFDNDMQQAAFEFLERHLMRCSRAPRRP